VAVLSLGAVVLATALQPARAKDHRERMDHHAIKKMRLTVGPGAAGASTL
jgi:hypothetical protein